MNISAQLGYAAKTNRAVGVAYVYALEALAAIASNLLMAGIFFYMTDRFHWGAIANLFLAAGQGVSYLLGAISANRLSRVLTRRGALLVSYGTMGVLAAGGAWAGSANVVAAILVLYAGFSGTTWPVLESLISNGIDPERLSKRIAIYNLTWSAMGALVMAVCGTIIDYFRPGIFIVPLVAHGVQLIILFWKRGRNEETTLHAHAALTPDPQLLHLRTLALWLARLSVPATCVVAYSLLALMPSLSLVRQLSIAGATLLGSVWLAARCLMFVLLWVTTWWHTRPRLLLAAAVAMLVAFIAVIVRPSDLLHISTSSLGIDIVSMCVGQIILGMALGLVYAGSLYFGMVLSNGATEHGGYHEALLGLGSILGPGSAALVQWLFQGSPHAAAVTVCAVLGLTVAAAVVTTIRLGSPREEE